MHATHARNTDECAEKDGEWLEFYDYLDIVERTVSEITLHRNNGPLETILKYRSMIVNRSKCNKRSAVPWY